MYSALSDSSLSKLWTLDKIFIDNWMFRLHYVVSVTVLVSYSVLSVIEVYAGDPIDCQQSEGSTSDNMQEFIDSYCYIHGTRSLKWPSKGKAHDTIGDFDTYCEGKNEDECITEHPHYQWVALFILVQAAIFYIPRFLWYAWEGGKMASLVGDLATTPKFVHDTTTDNTKKEEFSPSGDDKTKDLANTFYESLGTYRVYVIKFCISEFLCLVVVIFQIYITDVFLGGQFMSFGSDVIKDVRGNKLDPMGRILPIVTSCKLSYHGQAGHETSHNSICVLPQNIVHQKFYVFFWFWLVALTILTGIHQVWRFVLLMVPEVRTSVSKKFWTNADEKTDKKVDKMMAKRGFEDWFVLSLIHANLPNVTYQLFKEDLAYVYSQKNL